MFNGYSAKRQLYSRADKEVLPSKERAKSARRTINRRPSQLSTGELSQERAASKPEKDDKNREQRNAPKSHDTKSPDVQELDKPKTAAGDTEKTTGKKEASGETKQTSGSSMKSDQVKSPTGGAAKPRLSASEKARIV